MELKVEISPGAFQDIDEIVAYIHANAPLNAARWHTQLFEKLEKFGTFPRGYPLAPENEYCDFEVRQLVFGRYRILFTVDDECVYVLTVRHGARQFMGSEDLEERHPGG